VRIIVRKPSTLEEGEYRSHIKVTIAENNVDKEGNPPAPSNGGKGMQVHINARFSMVIPFILRQGDPKVALKFGESKLRKEGEKYYLDTELLREGKRSAIGDMKFTFLDAQGKETVLKYQTGLAVYRPTAKRKFSIDLDVPKGLELKNGKIKLRYFKQEKEGGETMAESEIKV
jgi:hypothetical protein